MKKLRLCVPILLLVCVGGPGGCNRQTAGVPAATSAIPAAVLVESSGSKQIANSGSILESPIVVQANDAHGNGVAGVLVKMSGPHGFTFEPASGPTDTGGQFTTTVRTGPDAGKFQVEASSTDQTGKTIDLKLDVVVLSYQQAVGSQLNQQYCSRCHNSESTAERVSNYDNLKVKPHVFTDSQAMKSMKDADMMAILVHGGPGIGKSAEMPAYGRTFKKSEMEALIAYIRAVSETQYTPSGTEHAKE